MTSAVVCADARGLPNRDVRHRVSRVGHGKVWAALIASRRGLRNASCWMPTPRHIGIAIVILLVLLTATAASARRAPVHVYPIAGSRSALPTTQITFRGLAPKLLRVLSITGTRSGPHVGHLIADPDGRGGSFIPDTPFTSGETVTVRTKLNVVGGIHGTFRFIVAHPAAPLEPLPVPMIPAGDDGVQRFHSRPDLMPARLEITRPAALPSLGDIFVAPEFGPVQDGPMLIAPNGRLLWFHPVKRNTVTTDFREQRLWGHPVLTWWQGDWNSGGVGIILSQHYRHIATVRAGNGLSMDGHEFLLTPKGQAWIIAISRIRWPGIPEPVLDSVIQEIDIRTRLVMFEWHAIDHIPLSESFFTPRPGADLDPYHLNSIALDPTGNLIVSTRRLAGGCIAVAARRRL